MPDIPIFTPSNWYWFVGGDETRVFSSKVGDYVAPDDPTYVAWRAAGNLPTRILNVAELGEVLAQHRVRPANAGVLDAFKDSHAGKIVIEVPAKLLLWMVNEIRQLKGQQALGAAAFRAFVKGQM